MGYKVVVDSCGELTGELKQSGCFVNVPLQISVDDYHIVDDETFDQKDFLHRMKASPNVPKSTCPSPEKYMAAYECDAERIYAVTLSAELSGSYNSAQLGKNLYIEEHGQKYIHVFNSKSASIGETLVAYKIKECEETGMSFEEVISTVEEYIESFHTYFVLETLESLRKNGRLSNMKAFVASALNIKPVMGSTPEGAICQLDQARGMKKALDKMVDQIMARTPEPEKRMLAISHCNCPERAQQLKENIAKVAHFKEIFVLDTRGISSLYANDGGVIVAV
jgi:DegV family protein with EDD domain